MKKPFVTLEQAKKIIETYPTPFHIYDEKGIRENARRVIAAFSWNKGFKEYFAVKATPNPYLPKILQVSFADFEGGGLRCGLLLLHRAAVGGCCWAKGRGYYVFLQRNPGGGFHQGGRAGRNHQL